MERIKRCKFRYNLREFIWARVSGKQSSLNLSIFILFLVSLESFSFHLTLIGIFVKLSFSRILGLNFSFHLILIEFSVKLSFSRILKLNFPPLFF